MSWVPSTQKLDEEFNTIKTSGRKQHYTKISLVLSVLMFFYSFLGCGLETNPSSRILIVFFSEIKISLLVIGGWVHYLNFYSLGL